MIHKKGLERSPVLVVISASAPPKISGSASVMYELLRHFPSGSFILVTRRKAPGVSRDNRSLNVSTIEMGSSIVTESAGALRVLLAPFTVFWIARALRKSKQPAEKLLAVFPSLDFLILSLLLSRLLRVPVYVYLHDCIVESTVVPIIKSISRVVERIVFEQAARVYSMSDLMNTYYKKKGFQTVTLPHGVDATLERHQPDHVPADVVRIGFAGMIYETNVAALADLIAAKRLSRRRIELNIATTASSIKYLRDLGLLKEIDSIRTFEKREEVLSLLAMCDLLFAPMSFESRYYKDLVSIFPTKVTEYWLVHRPILVYGPREYAYVDRAREDGYAVVVSERGAAPLLAAIDEICASADLRSSLVEASHRMVVEHESGRIADFLMRELEIVAQPSETDANSSRETIE